MASGFSFFSSPPHPTSNPWPRAQSTFFTPQQPSKHNRSGVFGPTSPSPLRTSSNANLMSSPLSGGDGLAKHFVAVNDGDENQSTLTTPATNHDSSFKLFSANTSNSSFLTPTTTPLFSFNAQPESSANKAQQQSAQDRAVQFQFSARARSSSPSALLQSHAKDNRDSRKRLFLDRLRNRRDDARSEKAGDQVMRMDFMRERKMWEAEKARSDDVDVDVDVDDLDVEDEQLSPTEEREIEELARQFYSQNRAGGTGDEMGEGMEDFSDDGYEEAFMEVLSQESPAATGPVWAVPDFSAFDAQRGAQTQQNMSAPDSMMDMS